MRYLLVITLLAAGSAWAESQRIEVYPISQHYWDTQTGDTLGEIVSSLLPVNHYLQAALTREIIALNPDVFPDGDPDRMLANKRIWLPNGVKPPSGPPNAAEYTVQDFQWGSIKRKN